MLMKKSLEINEEAKKLITQRQKNKIQNIQLTMQSIILEQKYQVSQSQCMAKNIKSVQPNKNITQGYL